MWGRESPAAARAFHRGGTDAHLRERPGLQLSFLPGTAWGAFSNFQPLPAPIAAGPWTFVTSEHRFTRPVNSRCAPRRPATHRRGPHGQGGGGHRPHPGSRHRSRLECAVRRRHALGAAPEARVERSRDRRSARRDGPSSHRGGLHARPLVGGQAPSPTATRARTSSAASGWSSAGSFATDDPASPLPCLGRPHPRRLPRRRRRCGSAPDRAADRRCAARPIDDRQLALRLQVWSAALL